MVMKSVSLTRGGLGGPAEAVGRTTQEGKPKAPQIKDRCPVPEDPRKRVPTANAGRESVGGEGGGRTCEGIVGQDRKPRQGGQGGRSPYPMTRLPRPAASTDDHPFTPEARSRRLPVHASGHMPNAEPAGLLVRMRHRRAVNRPVTGGHNPSSRRAVCDDHKHGSVGAGGG